MLGEAAYTAADARRYRGRLCERDRGDRRIGRRPRCAAVRVQPSISVKLSALHPRYELAQAGRVLDELVPTVIGARRAAQARRHRVHHRRGGSRSPRAVARDFRARCAAIRRSPAGRGWASPCRPTRSVRARSSTGSSRSRARRARASRCGWSRARTGTPRSSARRCWASPAIRCSRARRTPTSRTSRARGRCSTPASASIRCSRRTTRTRSPGSPRAPPGTRVADFEFQRLHGMGEALYAQVCAPPARPSPAASTRRSAATRTCCRTSCAGCSRTARTRRSSTGSPIRRSAIADLVADPAGRARARRIRPANPRIAAAARPLRAERAQLGGRDARRPAGDGPCSMPRSRDARSPRLARRPDRRGERVGGVAARGARPVGSLGARSGRVVDADEALVDRALASLAAGAAGVGRAPAARARGDPRRAPPTRSRRDATDSSSRCSRAKRARRARPRSPKCARRPISAATTRRRRAQHFAEPLALPSPTGESNALVAARARRVRVHLALELPARDLHRARSPRRWPRATRSSRSRPSRRRSTAALAVRALLARGRPADVLALLPGRGESVGAALVADPRVAGVAFTGSTEVGRDRSRSTLAARLPLVPLIAETGGQNAMIVDSSALPEQVVADALVSAFDSAGQRCSALRVLCVQDDIAPRVVELLAGAMDELVRRRSGAIARPTSARSSTRDGAVARWSATSTRCTSCGFVRHRAPLPRGMRERHVRRADADRARPPRPADAGGVRPGAARRRRGTPTGLDALVDAINATGYGLTLGIHSRIDATIDAHRVARARRQRLRQPQHDRRGRRRAAVRRRGPVGHRPEGGRPALPGALRRRARR